MMFDLTGMTALVTGASGGIGSSIARALAGQGARLALSGSNAAKLEAFRAELGGDHVAIPCDLSNPEDVEKLVPAAVEALGKLDILILNAATLGTLTPLNHADPREFAEVFTLNVSAQQALIAAFDPLLRKSAKPQLIGITSSVATASGA